MKASAGKLSKDNPGKIKAEPFQDLEQQLEQEKKKKKTKNPKQFLMNEDGADQTTDVAANEKILKSLTAGHHGRKGEETGIMSVTAVIAAGGETQHDAKKWGEFDENQADREDNVQDANSQSGMKDYKDQKE